MTSLEPRCRTTVVTVAGSSLNELCRLVGFSPDPGFWVGDDTPPFRDPDQPIRLDGLATSVLGEWYLLGQRAIDEVVASLPDPAATVGRLWPEHFDYGIDLAAAPASAATSAPLVATRSMPSRTCTSGHGGSPNPVSNPRPHRQYWNAPFGAFLPFADVDVADDPIGARSVLHDRLAALRSAT